MKTSFFYLGFVIFLLIVHEKIKSIEYQKFIFQSSPPSSQKINDLKSIITKLENHIDNTKDIYREDIRNLIDQIKNILKELESILSSLEKRIDKIEKLVFSSIVLTKHNELKSKTSFKIGQ